MDWHRASILIFSFTYLLLILFFIMLQIYKFTTTKKDTGIVIYTYSKYKKI